MTKSNRKRRKKKLTISSVIGIVIGCSLIGIGLYQALVRGNPGAYFVVFLGLIFNAVIYFFYKD